MADIEFETDDIYLAAYFSLSGCEMQRKRRLGAKVWFIFTNPAGSMKELRETYYSGKGLVKPHVFVQQILAFKALCFDTLAYWIDLQSIGWGMGRSLPTTSIVRDQVDVFNPPTSFTRVTGISSSGLSVKTFINNSLISWPIVDGSSVSDSSVSSGKIYFNEIPGSPGFYSIRFYPDRVGFWRLVFIPSLTSVEIVREFDISPSSFGNSTGGLNATFVKP